MDVSKIVPRESFKILPMCMNVVRNLKNSVKIAVLLKLEKPHTTWMRLQLVAKILELVNDFEDPTLSTISKLGLGKSFLNYYRGPEIRPFIL